VLNGVKLVYYDAVRVQTVQAVRLTCQRFKFPKGHRKIEIGLALLQVLPQGRRLTHHVDSFGKNDPGLIPLRGHAIRLRSTFTITNEHVKPDAGQERRLSVLPADQQDELPAPPQTRLLVDE